ncbi:DUF1349 domain-containing protein [Saccharothrix sp. S26]|nr:DUF1349 domain-containing protein [Saccharothrix sp. S26]
MPPITCADPGRDVPVNDEFDGDRLDGCRWDAVVRPDLGSMRVAGGLLSIDTLPGDINGGSNDNPRNFVLQDAPDGDWTIETRMAAPVVEQWQLAGFMVYANDDDYVKFDVVARNAPGQAVTLGAELVAENNGQFGSGGNRALAIGTPESGWWHLRLKKAGNSYSAEISDGGTTWTSLGDPVTNDVPDAKFGLMAIGPSQTNGPVTVDFDYFRVSGVDTTAPEVTATVDPAQPDGSGGWWTTSPTVTITAVDAGSGVASTEYRVDGGDWRPYTAPVRVTGDGTHAVEYRATDVRGNRSAAGSVSVKVDASAPAVKVTGLHDGVSYGHAEDRVVAWQVDDTVSGVASVTAALDGKPITSGTSVALHTLALGAHALTLTATDKAGNKRDVVVSFTVTTSLPDLQALVDRFAAERRIPSSTARGLDRDLDDARRLLFDGKTAKAIDKLEGFRTSVSRKVGDRTVRDLLVADTDVVIAALRGQVR